MGSLVSGTIGTGKKRDTHLGRVLANFVVGVCNHNHLPGEIWEAIKLPPRLPELLGTSELEIRGTLARGWLRCRGRHGGEKGRKEGEGRQWLTLFVKSTSLYNHFGTFTMIFTAAFAVARVELAGSAVLGDDTFQLLLIR